MTSSALILAVSLVLQIPAGQYESKDGGFRVNFPAPAKTELKKVKTTSGPVDVRRFVTDKNDVAYTLSFIDYPPNVAQADPDKFFDEVGDNIIAGVKGAKLTIKRDLKIGPWPGQYVQFIYPAAGGVPGMGRARLYLAGSRLYTLTAIGPKEEVVKNAQFFMQSFVLSGKVGVLRAPAENAAAPPAALADQPPNNATARGNPVPFASQEHGFRVTLPGKPQQQKVTQPTAAGPIDVFLFVVPPRNQEDITYAITVTKLPAAAVRENPQSVLKGVLNGSIASTKGTMILRKPIDLDDAPGIEFEFTMPVEGVGTSYTRSRAFVSNGRSYQIILSGPKTLVTGPIASACLDSFELFTPIAR